MNCFGHTLRRSNVNIVKQTLQWTQEGHTNTKDHLKEGSQERNGTAGSSTDGERWRQQHKTEVDAHKYSVACVSLGVTRHDSVIFVSFIIYLQFQKYFLVLVQFQLSYITNKNKNTTHKVLTLSYDLSSNDLIDDQSHHLSSTHYVTHQSHHQQLTTTVVAIPRQ